MFASLQLSKMLEKFCLVMERDGNIGQCPSCATNFKYMNMLRVMKLLINHCIMRFK